MPLGFYYAREKVFRQIRIFNQPFFFFFCGQVYWDGKQYPESTPTQIQVLPTLAEAGLSAAGGSDGFREF
jgi:uncharacterized protein with PIN domain